MILLLINGKRKSGKDFISEKIQERLGKDLSVILRISAPLKAEYAKIYDLDYERLLDSSHYKEFYRESMVKWGEEKRKSDEEYFCKKVVTLGLETGKSVWIISDIRRNSDIRYFEKFENIKLRIEAKDDTRKKRGWKFTQGIDDEETENDLDLYGNWDFKIDNDGDMDDLCKNIAEISDKLFSRVKDSCGN